MPSNYGQNPPLSYNKYLRVQDLIKLQDCLSDPAHHDELLFITVHQAYELWFKQIHILETMTPLNFLAFRDELNPASGFQSMQFREIEFSSGLKDERILAEFAEDPFARERLAARLAQPSLADVFYKALERRGFDVSQRARAGLEILTHFEERYEEFQLAEA